MRGLPDRAGNATVQSTSVTSYSYAFLQPLGDDGRQHQEAGRTIPVKFVVQSENGSLVEDTSVTVALLNSAGAIVVGPHGFSHTPHDGVVYKDSTGYHANLDTAGVAPGSYLLRVRFDSPTLVGDLLLGVDLT